MIGGRIGGFVGGASVDGGFVGAGGGLVGGAFVGKGGRVEVASSDFFGRFVAVDGMRVGDGETVGVRDGVTVGVKIAVGEEIVVGELVAVRKIVGYPSGIVSVVALLVGVAESCLVTGRMRPDSGYSR